MANIGDLSIQIEAIDNASKTLAQVSKNLNGFSNNVTKQTKTATAGFGGFSAGAIKAGAAAGLAFMGIQSLAQGVMAMGSAMVQSASNLEQNRVAFDTMLGSAEQAAIMMQKISDFAMKTPFTLPQVQEGAKQLLAYNISAEKILPTFEALGNIAAGVGKDKLPQLVLAFGQVRAAQKLTGNELRQFTEAGVPLLEVLAKQAGKTAAEVKDDMENGMAPSFEEVEKAMFSLSEKGGKFEGLMEKQSKTVSGSWSNVVDAFSRMGAGLLGVSATGEVAAGSLYATLQSVMTGIVSFLNNHVNDIVLYGRTIIAVFTSLITILANGLQTMARVAILPFKIAFQAAKDGLQQIKNLATGQDVDWSAAMGMDAVGKGFSELVDGIKTDGQQIFEAMDISDALAPVNIEMGELKKTSDTAGGSLGDTSGKAKSAAKEFENLGKKVKEANKKIKESNKDYKEDKKDLKKDYNKDLNEMEKELEQTLVKLNSDFAKAMTKVRADYNKEMASLQEDLQKDLAKIDEAYNKDSINSQKDTSESIAGVIVGKQDELKSLEEEMAKESSSERRWEMAQQIAEIQAFLEKHKGDVETYGAEIKAIQDFNNLDEIEQLKFKHDQEKLERERAYAEAKAERIAQYEEQKAEKTAQLAIDIADMQAEHVAKEAELNAEYLDSKKKRGEEFKEDMKELKKEHKEKLKELKEHLKDVKKELAEFVASKEYQAAKRYTGGSEGLSGKRATGGPISRNKPYLVGERGPELIIPASSGKVVPTQNLQSASQANGGGGTTIVNVDIGMYAGNYSEKRKLGEEILRAINQTRQAKGLSLLS